MRLWRRRPTKRLDGKIKDRLNALESVVAPSDGYADWHNVTSAEESQAAARQRAKGSPRNSVTIRISRGR